MGITDPTQEYFKDGAWGWDGSEWIKAGIPFAFYDRWAEGIGEVKSGDGTYDQETSPVPAGEMWAVTKVVFLNNTGARGVCFLDITADGALMTIGADPAPVQYEEVSAEGPFFLDASDYVRARQYSCLDGDIIECNVFGYKMKVA